MKGFLLRISMCENSVKSGIQKKMYASVLSGK